MESVNLVSLVILVNSVTLVYCESGELCDLSFLRALCGHHVIFNAIGHFQWGAPSNASYLQCNGILGRLLDPGGFGLNDVPAV